MAKSPAAPTPPVPEANNPHFEVWERTREALMALPAYFVTETVIAGLRATDIFTLSATLGATIEDQVVATLNRMRPVWDPMEHYQLYSFVRRPQTFPDVLLAKREVGQPGIAEIAFGIELKGWYLLAKEGEPSFRYVVTPAVCADFDLIVVVPWYLSNVIAGTPKVLPPYIVSARYAAEYRNYHWRHLREARTPAEIRSPEGVAPYPRKSDQISDTAVNDRGGNFGRFARAGLMDQYMTVISEEPISGIPARYWREFLKVFQETEDPARIESALQRMEAQVAAGREGTGSDDTVTLLDVLSRLLRY